MREIQKYTILSGGVGVGLQLRRLAHQEEPRRLCAQESEAELHEN